MKVINSGEKCPICKIGILVNHNSEHIRALICSENQNSEETRQPCGKVFSSDLIGQSIPEISILGAKNTSKTNYIYSLINMLNVDEKYKKAFNIDSNSGYEASDLEVYNSNIDKLDEGYFISQSEAGTLTYNYYLYRNNGSKLALICLQDSAGEAFSSDLTHLDRAYPNASTSEGLIVMLDPISFDNLKIDFQEIIPGYKDNKEVVDMIHNLIYQKYINNPSNISGRYQNVRGQIMRVLGNKRPKREDFKIEIPIAFCVAKFDILNELSHTYFASYDYFDDNSTFLMKNYTENSESLVETIKQLDPALMKIINSKFSNFALFPIHLATPIKGSKGLKFDQDNPNNFRGILSPLIWMLHKLNYLN